MTQASNIPAAEDPLGALRRSMSHSAEIAVAPIHDFRALLVHELERAEDAEIQVDAALRALGRRPKADATLYVTLEPCSTVGRTK